MKMSNDSNCKWTSKAGEAEYYSTACGKEYEGEADGFAYCPMCGRKMELAGEMEDKEDSSIPQPSEANEAEESEED